MDVRKTNIVEPKLIFYSTISDEPRASCQTAQDQSRNTFLHFCTGNGDGWVSYESVQVLDRPTLFGRNGAEFNRNVELCMAIYGK